MAFMWPREYIRLSCGTKNKSQGMHLPRNIKGRDSAETPKIKKNSSTLTYFYGNPRKSMETRFWGCEKLVGKKWTTEKAIFRLSGEVLNKTTQPSETLSSPTIFQKQCYENFEIIHFSVSRTTKTFHRNNEIVILTNRYLDTNQTGCNGRNVMYFSRESFYHVFPRLSKSLISSY